MSEKNKKEIIARPEGLWAASASEMTGLTPTPARNEYEARAYEDIMPYQTLIPPSPNGIVQDFPVGPANPSEFRRAFSALPSDEKLKGSHK